MIRLLFSSRSGSTATEFAMVLPLLLLFIFGLIDVSRWIWTNNDMEKATEMGARFAAVTDPVSSAINDDYIGKCSPALTQGDSIPVGCFSKITCISSSCDSGTINTTAFNAIVARVHDFLPQVTAANVAVEYSPSGLGYAGNPYGADLAPLVTVRVGGTGVTSVSFQPIACLSLCQLSLRSVTSTLTSEDLKGSQAN